MAEPIPLANGVKCPYCLWGVFRMRSRVFRDPNGGEDGIQAWYWKCSSDELLKCQVWYDPDYSEMENAYYAVVDGQVKRIQR